MFKIKREMEQTLSTQIIRYTPFTCYDFTNNDTTMLSNKQKYMDGKLMHLLCHKTDKSGWINFWIEKKYIKYTPINYKKTYKIINNIKN